MKRQGSTELPRFAVGALAIAGASAANAATVQITFTGSFISTTGGNHLVTDFGGDGVANLVGALGSSSVGVQAAGARPWIGLASGIITTNGDRYAFARAGPQEDSSLVAGVASVGARGLSPVSFADAKIRSGALTTGYLDITAYASQPGEKRVTVNRLIFDDATGGAIAGLSSADSAFPGYIAAAVPEPSSLGLLALGAGGLLTRRRRSTAA